MTVGCRSGLQRLSSPSWSSWSVLWDVVQINILDDSLVPKKGDKGVTIWFYLIALAFKYKSYFPVREFLLDCSTHTYIHPTNIWGNKWSLRDLLPRKIGTSVKNITFYLNNIFPIGGTFNGLLFNNNYRLKSLKLMIRITALWW